MKKRNKKRLLVGRCMLLLVIFLAGFFIQTNQGEAKIRIKANSSARKVKVGRRILVTAKTPEVTYASSDSSIASIDNKGVVTGKKAGNVLLYVKKKGYKTKTLPLCVEKSSRKPAMLPVSFSEISIEEQNGIVNIHNNAKKGKIKKVLFFYAVQVEKQMSNAVSGSAVYAEENAVGTVEKTVILTANSIAAGKSAPAIRKGDVDDMKFSLAQAKLIKAELYAGNARYVYDAMTQEYFFTWGTKDTTPPKFSGFLKKKSYTGNGDIYRVCYSDKKKSYNFKQFVTATDNRDGKVKVKADTSKINWKKAGVYRIYYRAEDRAGNIATSWAKIQVIVPETPEHAADQILQSIIRTSWSNTKKARAIYNYVRRHCSYVHSSAHIHWRKAALRGLRYQSGDCYTYYSMSRLLLTRAGISNVMIKRYPTYRGRHFWNLAYVQGGWYHFDTTPRFRGGNFCLRTDAQMWRYYGGYTFRFIKRLYPVRAAKRI